MTEPRCALTAPATVRAGARRDRTLPVVTERPTDGAPPPRAYGPVWVWAQAAGVALLGAFLIGLAAAPAPTLRVFWSGFVPALPALLMLHPGLWRNVCPLATLATLVNRRGPRAMPSEEWTRRAQMAGIVLLAVLIPARRLLFDASARATAAGATVACALALLGGLRFGWKSGFCNAFCPMLPLERLYGQAPRVGVVNGRCRTCTRCTRTGCIDLAGPSSIPQVLGRYRRGPGWMRTPFGTFALALPGLVVGYALAPQVIGPAWPGSAVAGTYFFFLACVVLSVGSAVSVIYLAGLDWRIGLRALASCAALLFYGLLARETAQAWGGGAGIAWLIRAASTSLIVFWLARPPARHRPPAKINLDTP